MAASDVSLGKVAARGKTKELASLTKPALLLCALALVLNWLPRLRWGLWTDETGTFWMAAEGWRAAIERTWTWAGQSILYSVLESQFVAGGMWLEPLLRLPSIVGMAIAAYQLKKLAERVIHPEAGWVAVVAFVCTPDVASFASSARPYALALAAALASMRYLLDWVETHDRASAAKYLLASVLTLHLHYLFGFIFVVQALYLGFRWVRRERTPLWLPLTAALLLPLSLLPVLGSLTSTAQQKGDFAQAAKPELLQLLQWCFPPVLLLTAGLGGLLLFVSARGLAWRPAPVKREHIFLTAVWLTLAPVLFFLVSWLTPSSIFAARYMLFTLPAFVLIWAWGVHGLELRVWRVTVLLAVFAGTVLHPGVLVYVTHDATNSWREPLAFVARAPATPVFVASGVVQSNGADWRNLDPHTSSLYAALSAYPVPNRAIALPYQSTEAVKQYLLEKATGEARFFLLAAADSDLGSWLSGQLAARGYRAVPHDFGEYQVVEYRQKN